MRVGRPALCLVPLLEALEERLREFRREVPAHGPMALAEAVAVLSVAASRKRLLRGRSGSTDSRQRLLRGALDLSHSDYGLLDRSSPGAACAGTSRSSRACVLADDVLTRRGILNPLIRATLNTGQVAAAPIID